MGPVVDPGLVGDRQRKRCVARSRADAGVVDPELGKGGHQGGGEDRVAVGHRANGSGAYGAGMLADRAYDLGYAMGTVLAGLIFGYLLMWLWGLIRNHRESRLQSAWDWANHWRSLSAAGFLFVLSAVGRLID